MREVNILTGILTGLKSLVDGLSQNPQIVTLPVEYPSISKIGAKNGAIELCKEILDKVHNVLIKRESAPPTDKRRKLHSLTGRLLWPFEKEETEDMIRQLERLKTTFTLALSIDEM